MATPCCNCDHMLYMPQDPGGLPARHALRLSALGNGSLKPLLGAACALRSPVAHAAGFSDRGLAVLLCPAGVVRLIRRPPWPQLRWDQVLSAPGCSRPGLC